MPSLGVYGEVIKERSEYLHSLYLNPQLVSFLRNISTSTSTMRLSEHAAMESLYINQIDHRNGVEGAIKENDFLWWVFVW
jgi:hypothetical protein